MLFKSISFYLAIAGIVATLYLVRAQGQKPADPGPLSDPAHKPFANAVAATGLIEASRENVKIASPKSGLVTHVAVKVGDSVKKGDELFSLDDRETRARIVSLEAQLASAQAAIPVDQNSIEDWSDQLGRIARLEKEKVATEDELKRRQFTVNGAKAKLEATRAQIEYMRAQIEAAKVDLSVLSIRAPRDGKLLQVNVREGEFASAAALSDPLMLLGDVDKLQVRAEIDEQNAVLVVPNSAAVSTLKGHAELKMPLRFVRIEPYVVPKRSLTGDSLERVDTRVLQVIYEFDQPKFSVYVGQQVDVYIDRPGQGMAAAR
ncbi:MAG TPA: biotin/lipoyl-binding protein [Candidatus Limnocylindria bacterium]|jgi:RND family efflux transporter MFP subunit|nr:biotin/lipoyl-binding protein [Candidatus Limnocylindria bacterium]